MHFATRFCIVANTECDSTAAIAGFSLNNKWISSGLLFSQKHTFDLKRVVRRASFPEMKRVDAANFCRVIPTDFTQKSRTELLKRATVRRFWLAAQLVM